MHNSSFSFVQHHLHLSEVTSTNDIAKQLAEENLMLPGYVITTDFQSNGRGQENSRWEAERGKNILSSIILNLKLPIEQQIYLNLFISLAVYDFIKELCPNENVNIKWPNDIYVNNKKIAGILIENTIQGICLKQSIVGIGVNINQQVFGLSSATSLSLITGINYNVPDSTIQLLQCMEVRHNQLLRGDLKELWKQYHQVLYRMNTLTSFRAYNQQFNGIPIGIDEAGRLLVTTDDVLKTFNVKEIVWC